MGNQTNIVPSALPPQETKPYANGGNSPMSAGLATSQQQTNDQMALIGKSGGAIRKKSKRYMRGGVAPVSEVAPVPPGSPNPEATGASYTQLAGLANSANNNATYDNATSPSDTAKLQQQQQSMYKGGSKSRRNKSKKSKKIRKNKRSKKNRRSKRRHH